ncbi:MAG TPA: MFS transporter [Mycobacteriales bacterium]|jgi:MFS family permease|nr:MFS transporter [Mycobacteriales bacterium]
MTSTTAQSQATASVGDGGEANWRFLIPLGLPALGITFAVTVVSTYAPVLLGGKSSPLVVGIIVGGEGFFGLFVPLLVGALSDRFADNAQDRVRALLISAPVAAAALALIAVAGGRLGLIAVGAAVYFACHFAYLAPFQAMYADLVPDAASGRSRSAESIWRLVGAAGALIAGGFLIEAWKPSPFILATVLIVGGTIVFWRFLRSTERVSVSGSDRGVRDLWDRTGEILADRSVRRLVAANVLWNITLSGMRAFVVLFFTIGLGRSPSFVSAVIFPLVAVGMGASAPITGKLADHFGHLRVLRLAVPVYGCGLLLAGFTHATWVLFAVPVVAAAAATVMVVPFATLMRLMPDRDHGAISGVFTLSRGLGTLLGPVLAGAAILLLRSPLSSTHGYAAMWFVIGAATLASWPLLRD